MLKSFWHCSISELTNMGKYWYTYDSVHSQESIHYLSFIFPSRVCIFFTPQGVCTFLPVNYRSVYMFGDSPPPFLFEVVMRSGLPIVLELYSLPPPSCFPWKYGTTASRETAIRSFYHANKKREPGAVLGCQAARCWAFKCPLCLP